MPPPPWNPTESDASPFWAVIPEIVLRLPGCCSKTRSSPPPSTIVVAEPAPLMVMLLWRSKSPWEFPASVGSGMAIV